jgi:DNA polymerase
MSQIDNEKIAGFLDIARDYLYSGYRGEKTEVFIDTIEQIEKEIKACKKCPLCEKRTNAVPGEGVMQPLVMVIGEGPGEDEDKQGRPFVGKAGQLLDKMLSSINLSRTTNAFIANVVKCRPPGNRDPLPQETETCADFLTRQILLLNPKFILITGKVAAKTLLKTDLPIGKMRGSFTELKIKAAPYPVLCTYHPSALLREESYKRPAWEDLKLLKSKFPV